MSYIQAGQKIVGDKDLDLSEIKYAFVQKMRKAFQVETVGDGDESYSITAVGHADWGSAIVSPYKIDLDISVKGEGKTARVLIDGKAEITKATRIFYMISILLILIIGLAPGAIIDTSGEGTALDALIFMGIGAFIVFDINRKLIEPQVQINKILSVLNSEFG